jgi:hypothetical protein
VVREDEERIRRAEALGARIDVKAPGPRVLPLFLVTRLEGPSMDSDTRVVGRRLKTGETIRLPRAVASWYLVGWYGPAHQVATRRCESLCGVVAIAGSGLLPIPDCVKARAPAWEGLLVNGWPGCPARSSLSHVAAGFPRVVR